MKEFGAMIAIVVLVGCTPGDADRPPPYAMKFSALAASLENRGFHPLLEAEYDGRAWQILALREGKRVSLTVQASVGHLGEIRAAPAGEEAGPVPPRTAKPLSEIARQLEEAGYSPIVEAEFEEDGWEIEAFARVEVDLDVTGVILEAELDLDEDAASPLTGGSIETTERGATE